VRQRDHAGGCDLAKQVRNRDRQRALREIGQRVRDLFQIPCGKDVGETDGQSRAALGLSQLAHHQRAVGLAEKFLAQIRQRCGKDLVRTAF